MQALLFCGVKDCGTKLVGPHCMQSEKALANRLFDCHTIADLLHQIIKAKGEGLAMICRIFCMTEKNGQMSCNTKLLLGNFFLTNQNSFFCQYFLRKHFTKFFTFQIIQNCTTGQPEFVPV